MTEMLLFSQGVVGHVSRQLRVSAQ